MRPLVKSRIRNASSLLPLLPLVAVLGTPAVGWAQVGPFPAIGEQPVSPLPKEDQQREARDRARAAAIASSVPAAGTPAVPAPGAAGGAPPQGKLSACLATIDANASGAADAARGWLAGARGAERVDAAQCLGSAEVALGEFGAARAAFLTARDAAAAGDHASRARLGAMAGNAALGDGDATAALAALDQARGDAGSDRVLAGGIAVDRARALVALKRDGEAGAALAEARSATPDDAEAWLLSATLARRGGRLDEAQGGIERAATLAPTDPAVGLEAGVIAMLSGRTDAARRSWRSVIAAAPAAPAAATARGYLAQVGDPAPPAVTPVSDTAARRVVSKEPSR